LSIILIGLVPVDKQCLIEYIPLDIATWFVFDITKFYLVLLFENTLELVLRFTLGDSLVSAHIFAVDFYT